MKVHERISQRRKELGLSAEQVAEALGVTRSTIYRYESSDIEKLPAVFLEPLAAILQVTPWYLMGWDEKSPAIPEDSGVEIQPMDELDTEFMEKFSRLTPEQKDIMLAQIDGIIARRERE